VANHAARLTLALALTLAAATPAHAHKLKVFATADGAAIEGRVYFVGGAAAPGVAVAIEVPPGTSIAAMATDGDGRFRFQASSRTDHLIVADTGDGHAARFTIAATELPVSLSAPAAVAGPPSSRGFSGRADAHIADPEVPPASVLVDMLADAVSSQVRPLREQLNDYEDQVRLRDIIGGIGYIFGLAGTVLWLRAARRPGAGG
jgi:nickel transport protein